MAQRFIIALLLMVVVSTGCASSQGFDRPAISEALHLDVPVEQDHRQIINQTSNLFRPFRLGVFFLDHEFPNRQSVRNVQWLSTDRDQLLRELAPLQGEHILADTFVLMDATLRGENVSGIRQSGARYGADMVLIVDGAAAIDRYHNRYAWWYPTLIGAYLAPGTESAVLVIATGSLWGVKSEWHSPTQTVEGVSKFIGPTVFVDDNIVMGQAKEAAIEALSKRIVDQLRLLKEELHRARFPSR